VARPSLRDRDRVGLISVVSVILLRDEYGMGAFVFALLASVPAGVFASGVVIGTPREYMRGRRQRTPQLPISRLVVLCSRSAGRGLRGSAIGAGRRGNDEASVVLDRGGQRRRVTPTRARESSSGPRLHRCRRISR
jgi:hypothetical protein